MELSDLILIGPGRHISRASAYVHPSAEVDGSESGGMDISYSWSWTHPPLPTTLMKTLRAAGHQEEKRNVKNLLHRMRAEKS